MTFLVLAPNVEIITLTRDMALSRQEEIDYLNKHGFYADFTKLKYSYNVGCGVPLFVVVKSSTPHKGSRKQLISST